MTEKKRKENRTRQSKKKGHEEIITTHLNTDFDALASMIAAKKLYPEATLVFPGSHEKNLRNFFLHTTSYIFNFTRIKQIDFDRVRRLILVDTRQKSRIGKFAELSEKEGIEIHIYDHHPDSEDDIQGDMEVIREVGAATSILTDIIKRRGLSISSDEATIMCLGIHEDTGSFTFSSTKPEDYMAAAWLSEQGANHNLIADMLTRELTAEQVWLLNDLTQSATTGIINGIKVVIARVIRDDYIGDFAALVHKFMEMEGLDVIFALAQMEDKIYLVARSRLTEVNVAEIALEFGGGGHPQAASASIKNQTLIQVEKSLQSLLESHINPRKTARDLMSSPVIQIAPQESLKEAASIITKYNINVLIVTDEKDKTAGYITRQIVEKAVFLGLGDINVKDYMHIEFKSVGPDASLKEVQELIIKNRLRILPVMKKDKIAGVITRTDLLNILTGGPVIPDFLYEPRHTSHFAKKKNMAAILKERLPEKIIHLFKEFGVVADLLGYNAYLVGGIVRDIFLRHENLDVDIVIEGEGIRFAHEFARHHEVRVKSHRKFGTAVLIFPDGFKVDVATARIEYYESPAAPPIVEMSSLKMDLFRRDFTINTIAVKLNKRHYGVLVDYFGAQADLKEKVIRVLHNLSFVEDPTRIFRAIRFEKRFGFKIGKLTLALMKNVVNINCIQELSGRRLFLELKLLLMEQNPLQTIVRMDEFGLLQFISPKIEFSKKLKNLFEEIRGVISWYNHLYIGEPFEPWKVYWYGLTSSLDSEAFQQLTQRLQMNDLENKKMISRRMEVPDVLERLYMIHDDDRFQTYSLLNQYDTEILLYMMAKANNEKIKRMISNYFTGIEEAKVLLKGQDLKEMGFQPGPLYRKILDSLLEARLNKHTRTKEDETSHVKKKFGKHLDKL